MVIKSKVSALEKKVLLVKKVKAGDIDLSLKQVSKDQKKQKLKEVKKYEKGKTLLQNVQDNDNEPAHGSLRLLYIRKACNYHASRQGPLLKCSVIDQQGGNLYHS